MVSFQQEKASKSRSSSASVSSLGGRHGAAFWSEERASGSVGVKLLERMGWQEGKGLGRQEGGTQSFIRARLKNDTVGIGAKKGAAGDERQNAFAQATTDMFNALLSKLNAAHTAPPTQQDGSGGDRHQAAEEEDEEAEEDTSTVGDAAASIDRFVRKRHLYGRFSRAKDTSLYSQKSKLEIFGRKQQTTASAQAATPADDSKATAPSAVGGSVATTPPSAPSLTTTSSVSIQSYFASKMAARQQQQPPHSLRADGSDTFQTALFDDISQRSNSGRAGLGLGAGKGRGNAAPQHTAMPMPAAPHAQHTEREHRQSADNDSHTATAGQQSAEAESAEEQASSEEERRERKRRRKEERKEAKRLLREQEEQQQRTSEKVHPAAEETADEPQRRKKSKRERESATTH